MKDLTGELSCTVPKKVAVVAFPGLSLLELGAIVEPLAFAARTHPASFSPIELAGGGAGIASDNGFRLVAPFTIADLISRLGCWPRPSAVFICCGETLARDGGAELRRLVRACRRHRIRMFVTGAALSILAEFGLLHDRPATAHWGSLVALRETYPMTSFVDALFVSSDGITSCAGETAAFDMVMSFLGETLPDHVLAALASHFMTNGARAGCDRQPGSLMAEADRLPHELRRVILAMTNHVETPRPLPDLCRHAGLSQRQIERLFQRHLSVTPRAFYISLRLDRARQIVRKTGLPLHEVAVATGFASVAVLSRRYAGRFGTTPSDERRHLVRMAMTARS